MGNGYCTWQYGVATHQRGQKIRWFHRKIYTFQAKIEATWGYCVMVKGVFELQSSSKQKVFPELLAMLISPNVFFWESWTLPKTFKNILGVIVVSENFLRHPKAGDLNSNTPFTSVQYPHFPSILAWKVCILRWNHLIFYPCWWVETRNSILSSTMSIAHYRKCMGTTQIDLWTSQVH